MCPDATNRYWYSISITSTCIPLTITIQICVPYCYLFPEIAKQRRPTAVTAAPLRLVLHKKSAAVWRISNSAAGLYLARYNQRVITDQSSSNNQKKIIEGARKNWIPSSLGPPHESGSPAPGSSRKLANRGDRYGQLPTSLPPRLERLDSEIGLESFPGRPVNKLAPSFRQLDLDRTRWDVPLEILRPLIAVVKVDE